MSSNSLPDYTGQSSPKSPLRTTQPRKLPQSLVVVCNKRRERPITKGSYKGNQSKEVSAFQNEASSEYYGVESTQNAESVSRTAQRNQSTGSTTSDNSQLYSRRSSFSENLPPQSSQKSRPKKRPQGVMFSLELWSDKHFKTVCHKTGLNTYTDNMGKEHKMSLKETREGFRDILKRSERPLTGSISLRSLDQLDDPLEGASSSNMRPRSFTTESIELDEDNIPVKDNTSVKDSIPVKANALNRKNYRILTLNPKLVSKKSPLFGSEASVIEELAPIKEDTEDLKYSRPIKYKTGSPNFIPDSLSNPQSGIQIFPKSQIASPISTELFMLKSPFPKSQIASPISTESFMMKSPFPKSQIASPISAESFMLKTPTSLNSSALRRFNNDHSTNSGLLSSKAKSQKSIVSAELPSRISKAQALSFYDVDLSSTLRTKIAAKFNNDLNEIIKGCDESMRMTVNPRQPSYVKPTRSCISNIKVLPHQRKKYAQ